MADELRLQMLRSQAQKGCVKVALRIGRQHEASGLTRSGMNCRCLAHRTGHSVSSVSVTRFYHALVWPWNWVEGLWENRECIQNWIPCCYGHSLQVEHVWHVQCTSSSFKVLRWKVLEKTLIRRAIACESMWYWPTVGNFLCLYLSNTVIHILHMSKWLNIKANLYCIQIIGLFGAVLAVLIGNSSPGALWLEMLGIKLGPLCWRNTSPTTCAFTNWNGLLTDLVAF